MEFPAKSWDRNNLQKSKKKTDDDDIIKKIINLVRTAKKTSNIAVLVLDQQATQEQVIDEIKKILGPSGSHEAPVLFY